MSTSTERIRDLPEDQRPREKLESQGASSLSQAELIALFLGSGLVGRSAIQVARDLLEQCGDLHGLQRATLEDLTRVKGIGRAKAIHLLASFELGRRLASERAQRMALTSPEDVYEFLAPQMASLPVESLRVVLLDTRHQLIRCEEISRGTVNESLAHPREILRPVLHYQAYAFILVHNHPSGDPNPSLADRSLTRRIVEAARIMQVECLDHLIIGRLCRVRSQAWFSFQESGLMT